MLRRVDDGRGDGVSLRNFSGLTDDYNEAAAVSPAHMRRHTARKLPGAENLGLKMAKKVVAADLGEPPRQMRAGVTDDDVNAAERFDDIFDQRRDVLGLADIGNDTLGRRRLQRC